MLRIDRDWSGAHAGLRRYIKRAVRTIAFLVIIGIVVLLEYHSAVEKGWVYADSLREGRFRIQILVHHNTVRLYWVELAMLKPIEASEPRESMPLLLPIPDWRYALSLLEISELIDLNGHDKDRLFLFTTDANVSEDLLITITRIRVPTVLVWLLTLLFLLALTKCVDRFVAGFRRLILSIPKTPSSL